MNEEKILVTGHKSPDTDSICSAISYANLKNQMGIPAEAICAGEANKETQYALNYFKFDHPRIVTYFEKPAEGQPKQKVVLVDHNEKVQIIDGIENAEIYENIDHHRIGGLTTEVPIFIHYEPVGCTCTIVANLYWQYGQHIPQNIAGLLLSAILSDTVLFKSPTCTEKDKVTARKLADIAGVDLETYGMDMLKAGASVSNKTVAEIVATDMKEFGSGDDVFSIAQISVMDEKEVLAKKAELLQALQDKVTEKNYLASYLMITNILEESTDLLFAGDVAGVVEKAFSQAPVDGQVHLVKTMSRKKQIVPPILGAMK